MCINLFISSSSISRHYYSTEGKKTAYKPKNLFSHLQLFKMECLSAQSSGLTQCKYVVLWLLHINTYTLQRVKSPSYYKFDILKYNYTFI